MSIESKDRISPMIAVEGVGNVLLDSGEESSINSTSVSKRFKELTSETNDKESAVVEGLITFFVEDVDDELGRNSLLTDSEAATNKWINLICLYFNRYKKQQFIIYK